MDEKKRNKYKELEPMLHTLTEPWHRFDPEYREHSKEPKPHVFFEWDAAKHSLLEPWHLFDEENWDKIMN
jgi:hypothetical protein